MGFRIRNTSQFTGILYNSNILQTQNVIFNQRDFMYTIHIQLKDNMTIVFQYTVVIGKGYRACNDTGWVHGLRNWCIKQTIKIIEHIRICLSGCLFVHFILSLNPLHSFWSPRIFFGSFLIHFFCKCKLSFQCGGVLPCFFCYLDFLPKCFFINQMFFAPLE